MRAAPSDLWSAGSSAESWVSARVSTKAVMSARCLVRLWAVMKAEPLAERSAAHLVHLMVLTKAESSVQWLAQPSVDYSVCVMGATMAELSAEYSELGKVAR